MKTTTLLWAALVLLSFYFGYQLGTSQYNGQTFNTMATSDELPEQRSQKSAKETQTKQQDPSANIASDKKLIKADPELSELDSGEIASTIRLLLGDNRFSQSFKGIAEAYSLIENLTESELLEILQSEFDSENSAKDINALVMILSQYAEYDPQGAIDFVERNVTSPQSKMIATLATLKTWADHDPLGALNWYFSESKKASNQGILSGVASSLTVIFNSLATTDIELATSKLYEIQSSEQHLSLAAMGVINALSDKQEFADFLLRTEDLKQERLRTSVIGIWGAKNPLEMTQWLDNEYQGEDIDVLKQRAMASWMMSSPQESANWYVGGASEDKRQERVGEVVRHWSSTSPESAMDWLLRQSNIDYQSAVSTLLTHAIYSDFEFVSDNLELLKDRKQKAGLSFGIYTQLKKIDKDKAAEFLQASPYGAEMQVTLERHRKNVEAENR